MSVDLNCPTCGHGIRISEDLIGKKLRCKKCQRIFTAADPNSPFEEVPEVEVVEDDDVPAVRHANRGPRVRRNDAYDTDHEKDNRRTTGRSTARAAVQAPAIAMLCLGGLGFFLYLISLAMVLNGKGLDDQLARQNPAAYKLGYVIGMVFGLIWPIIVAYGGYKMKSLQNYSSVWVAVIFMLLPCNLGCLLGIPIGIWSMVILSQDEVRRSFYS